MSKSDVSPIQHQVSYEVGVLAQAPVDGWREGVPAPNARASCTCGQLDTGLVGPDEAWRAAQEHVKRELPGVDWGPDPNRETIPPVQCWHYEPGSPCDWNVCRQPERRAAGDYGTDPARGIPVPCSASDHCRPGRCMGLMCCSYECSQGRCPSIPAEFREPTP